MLFTDLITLQNLSSCQYVSTIPGKKNACYRPLKNRHFLGVCTEKTMDRQHRENGARNIHPNYNQMRAYVESWSIEVTEIRPSRFFDLLAQIKIMNEPGLIFVTPEPCFK